MARWITPEQQMADDVSNGDAAAKRRLMAQGYYQGYQMNDPVTADQATAEMTRQGLGAPQQAAAQAANPSVFATASASPPPGGAPGGSPPPGAVNTQSVFTPSGNAKYDSWLTALQGWQALDPAEMNTWNQTHGNYAQTDLIDKMLNETGGKDILSPFYQQMMKDQVGGAQAGYTLQGARDVATGNAANTPSFAQYLKNNFITGAGSGDPGVVSRGGGGPYGPEASGVGQIASMLQSIRAGTPQTAGGATNVGAWGLAPEQSRAFAQFFRDPANQSKLQQIMGRGIANSPFQAYLAQRQREEMARAEGGGATGGTDWMSALDNAARVGGIPYR